MKNKLIKSLVLVASLGLLTTSQSAVGLGGWVGYNFPGGVDLTACELVNGTCSKGGISFGGDLWLLGLGPVQIGAGAAYMSLFNMEYTSGSNKFEFNANYIPVYGQVRVDLMGFFGGAMLGYGIAVADAKLNGVEVTSASASSGMFGVLAGYSVSLGPAHIDMGARLFIVDGTNSFVPFVGATLKI